jgi:protein gp37
MAASSIEWTEKTWNPVTGCNKVSQGCKYCYAEVLANRLQRMGIAKYAAGFEVRLHPEELNTPYKWKSAVIFVNSMSDLFHEAVPLEYIQAVFEVMNNCPQHQFQVLTKRAERLQKIWYQLNWTDNIWMGVSVENNNVLHRIESLRCVGSAVRFLSVEPLLEPIYNLDLAGIHWVIVGGESGPKARPMKKEWVLHIRDICKSVAVPFFFKQWGGKNKKQSGRLLEGKEYNEMPAFKHSKLLIPSWHGIETVSHSVENK